jgi:hypothetical protein
MMEANSKVGSEVIAANDRCLAASKKAVVHSAKHLKSAKAALKLAEEALEAARKEVEDAKREHDDAEEDLRKAEECWKSAQERWDVIEIPDEEDAVEDAEADERKPASKNKTDTTNTAEFRNKKRSERQEAGDEVRKKTKEKYNLPQEVEVEGCGVPEVNGVYKKYGFSYYVREGMWEGEKVNFKIQFDGSRVRIYSLGHNFYIGEYDATTPLPTSWRCLHDGKLPVPKIAVTK